MVAAATVCIVAAVVICGSSSSRPHLSPAGTINMPVHSEDSAREAFGIYVSARDNTSTDQYGLRIECYKNVGWLVYSRYLRMGHGGALYIGDKDGFRPATLNNLYYLVRAAYPVKLKQEQHREVMSEIVRLYTSADGQAPAKIISSVSEIPGYEKQSLEADLKEVVRPSWSYTNQKRSRLVYVLYTYRELGGVVSRYRFVFYGGETFYGAECFDLGRDIGDALYFR